MVAVAPTDRPKSVSIPYVIDIGSFVVVVVVTLLFGFFC